MKTHSSTICAIATPPGQGGVGIVRISGPDAESILRVLCPSLPSAIPSHKLILAKVKEPGTDEVLDEVLVALMKAPRSYTGEDVAEIHGHGGALNMKRLLEAVCRAGATPAGPGEFTQRAFLLGRMDLTQAEAVADIIDASHTAALKLAQQHLAGHLGQTITELHEALIRAIILTESAIDFSTEEHIYQLDTEDLLRRIDGVQHRIDQLLGTYDAGRQIREGIRVVILGRPNAGKSTLFNHLCGEPRAIVTEIPGTTRDYLEERVLLDGVALRLIDTAGLRDASDTVERIGVERSREQADQADLLLWVLDGSEPLALDSLEEEILKTSSASIFPILNKADLPTGLSHEDLEKIKTLAAREPSGVSLLSSQRPDALFAELAEVARKRLLPAQEGAVITRQRHRDALQRAREALLQAREATEDEMSHEFIALDLRLALEAFGEVVGRTTVDDLLNRIFSEFCIGK